MRIQLQRVRRDDVIIEWRDLETTLHREYDDLRREMETRLRGSERIRCVSDDSPMYVRWRSPEPEDLQ